MKRKLVFFAFFIASIILFAIQTFQAFGIVAFHADFFAKKGTIVIDAGHGGEDGGTVAVNGALEKDINLAIALELKKNLEMNHFEVKMVRETDTAVGDQSLPTIAERKRSDTRNRLKIVEETGDCLLISIHQNHFSESKYSGAQMFYSGNHAKSEILAEAIRKNIINSLQPENKRENKQADSNIFLLHNCQVPAVLVECGFLSNPEEAEKLCSDTYQKDMAAAIYNGVIDYLQESDQSKNMGLANG
ncbi:N-acetylmuramoyl-L-alanine amidase [Acutalibacter caecimuris]|uniref:N-acetylmuramoyl-L-alanine amidase n=1 Tax=Acutalibacter caecimuris TaxID=3093657 RepID=UPI002AC94C07|nr:N-acetylmuramoyl-L-alanine amidase [Acutalibacter sp. M00118]